ncbi:MAG: 4Fe-4S dicluster domain-containing protein [Desulfovibrionales bacterium]|nr:4Fe-4S dicluster domain-containing protein [Desulfovibrionales bacterium]
MKSRILKKDELGGLLLTLQKEYVVYAPMQDATVPNKTVWAELADGQLPLEHFVNTDMSPKGFLFPQSEVMMQFSTEHGTQPPVYSQQEPSERPQILWNIRPCDAKALAFMDTVFCQDDYTHDIYWAQKRDTTLLVGLACNAPCPSCFCSAVHCGPHHTEGLDVLLTPLDGSYLVSPVTERGEALMQHLPEASAEEESTAATMKAKAEERVTQNLRGFSLEKVEQASLMEMYDLSYWNRVCETCLNCGTCTFVCPTCHCFDIQDETCAFQNEEGRRVRNWDYCMAPLFTLHTSGHNPREKRMSRVRQRFMHKLKYIPMRQDGTIGCVGCGRCVRLCPVNIDIRDVAANMNAGGEHV